MELIATDSKRRRKKKRRRKRRPPWTEAHVRRLWWRAGFGATDAEAATWARAGKAKAIDHLCFGGAPARLEGPAPTVKGAPIDRENEFGHDVLWWLDRMVRTSRPLEEQMTLFWHDHFATLGEDTPLMLRQNETFRRFGLGHYPTLLREMTLDPALTSFLSLLDSVKEFPNENYARELLELFTLGSGHTEADVIEASRAMTGLKADRPRGNGVQFNVVFDPERHDPTNKTILRKTGAFRWDDVLGITVLHRRHAPFMVDKLWSWFIPTPIPPATRKELVKVYRRNLKVLPIVRRILFNDALYANLGRPDLVKRPVVFVAGLLRTTGWHIERDSWVYFLDQMGQRPFSPPSVAGWDDGVAWLSTNAMRARFIAANEMLDKPAPAYVARGSTPADLDLGGHLARARAAVGSPLTGTQTDAALRRLAQALLDAAPADDPSARQVAADTIQRSLRHLLISGPDTQLC